MGGEAYVGRSSLMFFAARRRGETGGIAPEALPTPTRVPFRLSAAREVSKLRDVSAHELSSTPVHSRILPHTIEHRMHALPIRDLQHPLQRILALVQNHMVRAVLLRNRRLRRRRRRPDDRRAQVLDQLHEQQTEAARGGVHEDDVALLHGVGFFDEGDGGEGLEEGGGGEPGVDAVGDGVGVGPGDGDVGGVRAKGVLGMGLVDGKVWDMRDETYCANLATDGEVELLESGVVKDLLVGGQLDDGSCRLLANGGREGLERVEALAGWVIVRL